MTDTSYEGRRYEVVAPRNGTLSKAVFDGPGAGEALVRVHVNGVCASDLPTWGTPQPAYPIPLGHEPVGTVVAVGDGVELEPGTRVTGRLTPSFADYVAADIRDIVEVPDEVETIHALGEPIGCVAEALRRTQVQLADRVAIIGLGFMGLCMVQLVSRSATAQVVAIDPRDDARRAALSCGADAAYHPDQLPGAFTGPEARSGVRGFDVVVEASGSASGIELATVLVRSHGTLSILGFHQGTREVDMQAWNWKAIDVVNAHVRDRDLLRESTRSAMAMIAAGRIDLQPLVTHTYPLDRIDEAFEALSKKPPGFIKAVIIND